MKLVFLFCRSNSHFFCYRVKIGIRKDFLDSQAGQIAVLKNVTVLTFLTGSLFKVSREKVSNYWAKWLEDGANGETWLAANRVCRQHISQLNERQKIVIFRELNSWRDIMKALFAKEHQNIFRLIYLKTACHAYKF